MQSGLKAKEVVFIERLESEIVQRRNENTVLLKRLQTEQDNVRKKQTEVKRLIEVLSEDEAALDDIGKHFFAEFNHLEKELDGVARAGWKRQ